MIVTWIEWSDSGLSMHENIRGLSKETIRGWVHSDGAGAWAYGSVDGKVSGIAATQRMAQEALMAAMGAKEIDPRE